MYFCVFVFSCVLVTTVVCFQFLMQNMANQCKGRDELGLENLVNKISCLTEKQAATVPVVCTVCIIVRQSGICQCRFSIIVVLFGKPAV